MSGALPPRPSPAAGATQGMATPQNALQTAFQGVLSGASQIIQVLMRSPGVDQAGVKKAAELFSEGVKLIAQAIQQSAGSAGSAAPASPSPPSAVPPG